jgi:hypothetical protein
MSQNIDFILYLNFPFYNKRFWKIIVLFIFSQLGVAQWTLGFSVEPFLNALRMEIVVATWNSDYLDI